MAYDVNIIQQSPSGLLNLRGDENICRCFCDVLGFELPHTPNTKTGNKGITAMWLGPDEWLIKTADGKEITLSDSLREAVRGQHAAVTLLSDSYLVFRVSGNEARAVLNQGTGIDLHPRSFSPGKCVRTSLGRMGVILHQVDGIPSYDVYTLRSYANYFRLWLDKAMLQDVVKKNGNIMRVALTDLSIT